MKIEPTCPICSGKNIFINMAGVSGNIHSIHLPGLGSFLSDAKLYPTICQDCGLVRFFADEQAMSKVKASKQWKRIETANPNENNEKIIPIRNDPRHYDP